MYFPQRTTSEPYTDRALRHSPTAFYVYSSVTIMKVPAISIKDGRPQCATPSTYYGCDSVTLDTNPQIELEFTSSRGLLMAQPWAAKMVRPKRGIRTGSIQSLDLHTTLTFQTPFTYIPVSSPGSEGYGYVPQTLIDWMAQDPGYRVRYPELKLCKPGGPPVQPIFTAPTSELVIQPPVAPVAPAGPDVLLHTNALTTSVAATVTSAACFNPDACAPVASPGAGAGAGASATEHDVGPNGLTSLRSPPPSIQQAATTRPLPLSPGPQPSPTPLMEPYQGQDQNRSPFGPEQIHQGQQSALPQISKPPNPASIIISLAPSASAIVVNGATSKLASPKAITPAIAPSPGITLGSNPATLSVVPVFAVSGQTLIPGSPAITIQGTPVSLAPSATAIVVAGRPSPVMPGKAPLIPIGSQPPITASAASHYILGSQTLIPGAPAIQISGTPVSLVPSATALLVGSKTIPIPVAPQPGFPVLSLGGQAVTAKEIPQYIAGSQTLAAGSPAITISGTPVSLAPGATALMIGSKTQPLYPTNGALSPFTVGSTAFTATTNPQYIVGGQRLSPGGPGITFSGTPISLAADASQIVIAGSTGVLHPTNTVLPPLTIGSKIYTADGISGYVIGSQRLSPGGPSITISGTPISLAADASQVVIAGSTELLHPTGTVLPPITIGSHIYTADGTAGYLLGGQTLIPGAAAVTIPALTAPAPNPVPGSNSGLEAEALAQAYTVGNQIFTPNPTGFPIDGTTISAGGPGVTISGTLISLEGNGVLDIGGRTISLPGSEAEASAQQAYTVANQIFTPNPTAFSIDGKTISAGGPGVTISGTLVSLEGNGVLDVGGSTISLNPLTSNSPNRTASATRTSSPDSATETPSSSITAPVLSPGIGTPSPSSSSKRSGAGGRGDVFGFGSLVMVFSVVCFFVVWC